jgi:hypothetical protein
MLRIGDVVCVVKIIIFCIFVCVCMYDHTECMTISMYVCMYVLMYV